MDENRDNSPRRREQRPSTPRTPRAGNQRAEAARSGDERSGHRSDSHRRGPYRQGPRRSEGERSGTRPARPPQDQRQRAPYVPADVDYYDLDRDVRGRLRTLSKENAERVGKHLILAGELLDTDPELAYEHAQAAVRRAGRVDVVREAAALTAYATGKYAEALREFRTVRRLSGIDLHRAAEADCERGLGRPERALDVISEAPKNLPPIQRAELAIVEAGARRDLGQHDMALIIIEDAPRTAQTRERLDSVRADILTELGRDGEAKKIRDTLPPPEVDDIEYEDLDIRADYEPEPRSERT